MTTKTIAILGGTGALGSGLARRWARAGHRVIIGSRSREKAEEAVQALHDAQARAGRPRLAVTGLDTEAAARAADIVALTVPYSNQKPTLEAVRPCLEGKILIDVTVPLRPPKVGVVQLPEEGSAGAGAQALLGASVRVVSAFQNVAADHLAGDEAIDCDVLVSGDDEEARNVVIGLVRDAGMRGWHAGPIANAAAAEALTSILIQINRRHKCHAGLRITDAQKVHRIEAIALSGIGLITEGDDLAAAIEGALGASDEVLQDGDVLVLAQKIVSKAEGRVRHLADVTPSGRAMDIAARAGKDPRLVELVLSESVEVLRVEPGVLVTETKHGIVIANAGVDQSNVAEEAAELALLLPENPDLSAERLRKALEDRFGVRVGVVINDSSGRAWRRGSTSIAVGCAGVTALLDKRGQADLFGRKLRHTEIAAADELATMASMVMGQADEASPAVLIRGAAHALGEGRARDLVRPKEQDLFR